ncbi:hypothetical protein AWB76_02804 [Caballeronia temeraria]|uniref:Uncharacterized protein n=1 Tax=Caballeronia temeraria TaxID=1777137 RepID=A0A158APT3_9BURK|nr:hypothetical protein [Caballeronia temeraria]SAK59739.1 hypothetical protein AWB76_02804 [Caballeronia temeraria]
MMKHASTKRSERIARLESISNPVIPGMIARVHQAHGYLVQAEADLLRLQVTLRIVQRSTPDPTATSLLETVIEHLHGDIERTLTNRDQLARDAHACGIDVRFFGVEHFEHGGNALALKRVPRST